MAPMPEGCFSTIGGQKQIISASQQPHTKRGTRAARRLPQSDFPWKTNRGEWDTFTGLLSEDIG